MHLILAQYLISEELERAKKLHDFPQDIIHRAAIVAEECGELVKAVNDLVEGKGSMDQVNTECVQVGAVAVRFLINQEERKI